MKLPLAAPYPSREIRGEKVYLWHTYCFNGSLLSGKNPKRTTKPQAPHGSLMEEGLYASVTSYFPVKFNRTLCHFLISKHYENFEYINAMNRIICSNESQDWRACKKKKKVFLLNSLSAEHNPPLSLPQGYIFVYATSIRTWITHNTATISVQFLIVLC